MSEATNKDRILDKAKMDGAGVDVGKNDKKEDLSLLGRTEAELRDINKKYPNKPVDLIREKTPAEVKEAEATMTSIFDLGLAPDMLVFVLGRLQFLEKKHVEFVAQKRLFKIRHNKANMKIADMNIAVIDAQIDEVKLLTKMSARTEGVLVTKLIVPGENTNVAYKDVKGKGRITLDRKGGIDKSGTVDVVLEFETKTAVDDFIKQIREVKKHIGLKPVEDKKVKKAKDGG
jgi:hypothetical protein